VANTAQARKRARQGEVRREHNVELRTKLRTFIKKVVTAIAGGNKEEAKQAYQAAQPVIDKMSGKGIIHKNKAARHKSRLSQQIKKMA
jgi:small subunit ribosomal protein S20